MGKIIVAAFLVGIAFVAKNFIQEYYYRSRDWDHAIAVSYHQCWTIVALTAAFIFIR